MIPIDFSTLHARYVPCHPLSDGIGFCDVSWQLDCWDGGVQTVRLRQPIILHHGALRYAQVQHLPLAILEAIADAYTAWARQQEEG